MEFVWLVSEELNSSIFTTFLFDTYNAPNGYGFDYRSNHEDIDVTEKNVREKA
jgi:hypothetical protein